MKTTWLALSALLAPSIAAAQVCEPADVQSSLQYLRRLSLDLRGRVPSVAELESVVASGIVDPAIIDGMIASEELVEQMRRYHRDLLWTNVLDRRLVQNVWLLIGPNARQGTVAYASRAATRTSAYRGAAGATCLDEPARFGSAGEILTTPDATDPAINREGWVEVAPYWNPAITVKVCAFDAQQAATAIDPRNGRTVDCSRAAAVKGCGCGPNLVWCQSGTDGTQGRILGSMNEQLLRFTDRIVREDRPYTDVLLAKDMEINGPIVHWLTHQTQTGLGLIPAIPQQNYALPDIPYDQIDGWVGVDRGTRHAGVLSMPGYIAKFQSNRGRANRFYNAFLCQYFEAQSPLPPATDECHREPDLTKRCGCKDCHLALEPAAGHWGRWAEAGVMPLEDPLFPKFNAACTGQQPNGRVADGCAFYFTPRDVTNPEVEQAFVGMLKAYVFASAETESNIEAGPEKIAQAAIDSGAFASCTVRRVWTRMMAREPSLEEAAVIDALAADFATDYSLKRLIRELVTRPEYVEANLLEKSPE
jgi:hypothetical protein